MIVLSALRGVALPWGGFYFYMAQNNKKPWPKSHFGGACKIVLTALSGRMRMIAKLICEAILWAQIRARARIEVICLFCVKQKSAPNWRAF